MKITFLVPPVPDGKNIPERVQGCAYLIYYVPNIYILYPATVLKNEGFEVAYVEGTLERWSRSQFCSFLRQDKSDVYCFYSVNLSQELDISTLELIREFRGDVAIIFFGPAPSDRPAEFVIDEKTYVVRGEPEYTLLEVIRALNKGSDVENVRGISWLKGDEVRHNESGGPIDDIDNLPFPARDLLKDRSAYYNPKLGTSPFTAVCTSRGCSYRCIYCVPSSLTFARELEYKRSSQTKPPVRKRSVENIIEEFEALRKDGYKAVGILDDQFVWGEERTIKICEGIGSTEIIWGCCARADHLTENIIKAMAKANCRFIDVGIESFDPKVLEYIKKDLDLEKAIDAIKLIQKYRIKAKINIMFGVAPFETVESIRYNRRKVRELNIDQVMYNIANPFPGTEFYDIAKKNGLFVNGDYKPVNVAKEANISYPHLTNKQLEREVRRANFEFFLSPSFILKNLRHLTSPQSVKAVWRKLF